MTCGHEALSPYTREGPGGPTATTTHQDRFAQRLRGILARINARIREAIQENDLFNLRGEALVNDVPDEVFETDSRDRAIAGFIQWLTNQLNDDYLTLVGPDRNQFIRAAYIAGIRNAHNQLSDLDVSFERPDADDLVSRPIHRSELQTLYTRCYENLSEVTEDLAQEMREELLEGFREGENPTKIARRLNDRVNSVGKWRSTLIARSEVMNAHTSGTVSRMREINRDADFEIAGSHGEFDAAIGQERTCDFCRRLNGTPLKPSELASGTVRFRGDIYRLGPPAHIQGRCNVGILVGGQITEPLEERLPRGISVVSGG